MKSGIKLFFPPKKRFFDNLTGLYYHFIILAYGNRTLNKILMFLRFFGVFLGQIERFMCKKYPEISKKPTFENTITPKISERNSSKFDTTI